MLNAWQTNLTQIGRSFSVSADLEVELEEFVCLFYTRKHHKKVINFTRKIWQR